MKISDIRHLLQDKRVTEEINKHLWIESQKAGYSIGIERATDEWLRLHAEGWIRFHMPDKYNALRIKQEGPSAKKKLVKRKAVKKRK